MDAEGHWVSHAEYEENLAEKAADERFLNDVVPLLSPGVDWRPEEAVWVIGDELVGRLPGDARKGGLADGVDGR